MGLGSSNRKRGRGDDTRKLVFNISSDYSEGEQVQQQIMAEVTRAGFGGREFFAIKLALEEAITNAIKHGNRLDRSKRVDVEAIISSSQVELTVEDQGPGFERQAVPDPTIDENLEKCSGRGILLIESYMTSVSWDRQGRRLRMVMEHQNATR